MWLDCKSNIHKLWMGVMMVHLTYLNSKSLQKRTLNDHLLLGQLVLQPLTTEMVLFK